MTTKKTNKKNKTKLTEKEIRKRVKKADRTPSQHRAALKRKVRYFYDLQRLRMATGGRSRTKEAEGAPKVDLAEIDIVLLEHRASELEIAEKAALRDVEDQLKLDKFYTEVLSEKPRFRGLGPTMAGVILTEIDIHRAETVSALWSYAGLAPVSCRRCKRCHTVVKENKDRGFFVHAIKSQVAFDCAKKNVERIPRVDTFESAKSAKPTKGEKLPYNAFLRAKLCGVLGNCLIKNESPYRKFYDDYKHRKASQGWGVSDGHRHNAAIRYMVKMLLLDIWREWRTMEGLSVREPYQEEYLGHKHGKAS